MQCWLKFKPIIERYREWEWSKDTYANWEYLSKALENMQNERDKDYRKKYDAMMETIRELKT